MKRLERLEKRISELGLYQHEQGFVRIGMLTGDEEQPGCSYWTDEKLRGLAGTLAKPQKGALLCLVPGCPFVSQENWLDLGNQANHITPDCEGCEYFKE